MRSDSPEIVAPKAMVYVLTGPVRGGKTTFLDKAVAVWKSLEYRIGGFLCPARWEDGRLIGYDLLDLGEGGSSSFLRKEEDSALRQKSGPYVFLPEGLKKAQNILLRDRDKDLLIVDEIGPLELKGGGLWPSVSRAIAANARCLCVVRQGILEEFREKLKTGAVSVFRFGDPGLLRLMTAEIFGAATGEPACPKRKPPLKVQVKFFAYFRDVFGSAAKILVLPEGSTLEALLSALCDTPERRAEIFDGQRQKAEVIILKNGTPVDFFEGLRTRIVDGDVIAVFPFMAGG